MKGAMGFDVVSAPARGLWRVARVPDPLQLPPLPPPTETPSRSAGNRYDAPDATYRVTYAGTTLECCFTETLARFRLDQKLPLAAIKREWAQDNKMTLGSIPADWRVQRLKANFSVPPDAVFVNVDHPDTLKTLRYHYGDSLAELGVQDLDRGDITAETGWSPDGSHTSSTRTARSRGLDTGHDS
ncbi:MAG TPA: hypothetical protein ENG98_00465, partial [Actinobacteria bacterium]|nr:hypothetical protein [Actinomycetota bacterium]